MTKSKKETLTIKYNGKEYEIKNQKEAQTIAPKGETKELGTKSADFITVENVEKKFWNTTAVINGSKVEVKWGNGKTITLVGIPSILAIVGGTIAYFLWNKKKLQKEKAETESL